MDQFEEWEATELFCPKCKELRRVRKRLLLVLPTGEKFDYVCSVCNERVGAKLDKDPEKFSSILIHKKP